VRPPRWRNGTPATSYSCASQPTPMPSSNRPPDKYCRLAMSLATNTGLRNAAIRMPVASLIRLVQPAAKPSVSNGDSQAVP